MKKLIAGLLLLPTLALAADYTDGNLRKNDNLWLNLNFYSAYHLANSFGDTTDDPYLEIEGGGRSGVMDFYYFTDVNNLLATGDDDDDSGDFFVKIMPRFSLDALFKKDLAIGPVKEWYLATLFKGGNGFERYYGGVGTDLQLPGFDVFSFNLLSMCEHVDANHLDYGGFTIAVTWYTVIHTFQNKSYLTYQGWSDFGFANQYESDKENGTTTEWQMFNGFFYHFTPRYALSASIKFYDHLAYRDAYNDSATSYFLGAHYSF
ncbi:MAG: outer membrane protein OmpK [Kiritimatiellae bacterium]|nr:outer membrane protein OmpK [Kiritimatiellia bacterium]